MNENALDHVNLVIDTFNDVIKGIFAVKGVGQRKGSIVSKMNIETKDENYSDKLRLLFMNLSSMAEKIGQEKLDKIIFDMDDQYLILKKAFKRGGSTPLFLSLLTEKNADLQIVETIFDDLFDSLFLLLR